jgi:N-hydroxyarylamine O-acetyltransferase
VTDSEIGLDRDLRDRVLDRLGFPKPPPVDALGLAALYRAWCERVPFDNVCKMIALLGSPGRPLPGRRAAEFFPRWLADGAGGTCWSSSNALFELVRSVGFAAERITGSMRDLGLANHASVRARIDGQAWLVDSSMLTNDPLPLGADVYVHGDPVMPFEVEPVEGTHVIWWDPPPNPGFFPCRLLPDPVSHAFYVAGYESSRERGGFNQRLYARRNRPGELLVLAGSTRCSRTLEGLQARELTPDAVTRCLRDDFGISEGLVQRWVGAGGLRSTLETPPSPPPSSSGKPPSKR